MNDWIGKSKNSIAILRISSRRQNELSHDAQEREVIEYAKLNGLNLQKTFKLVESAKDSEDRRYYMQAMEFALKHRIRHILFYMPDREARNLTDVEANEKLIRQDRIVVHYVRDRKVFHKSTPQSDFLMRNFQAIQNKNYSWENSIKVNDSMRAKAESGWFPSNHVPLGYVTERLKNESGRDKKNGAIVVPDPNLRNRQQVLREFELRAQGLSFEAIRTQIIAEGFIPPSKIKGYSKGCIEYRLKNPFYDGLFEWQGATYQGKHELIIPESLRLKVKMTFGKRGNPRKSGNKQGIFANGYLRCAHPECGCQVVYEKKKKTIKTTGEVKTFAYYHCTNGKRVHPTMRGLNVPEQQLWEKFGQIMGSIAITEEFASDIASALNENQEKARAAIRREMNSYRETIDVIKTKRTRLLDLLLAKSIDEATFREQSLRLEDEQNQNTNLLEQAQLTVTDAALENAKSILELATKAKTLWLSKTPLERKLDLEKILSNPVLDGQTVRYEMKKPFAVLVQMASSKEWWAL